MNVKAECCLRPDPVCVRTVYFTEHETGVGDTGNEDQIHYTRTCKEQNGQLQRSQFPIKTLSYVGLIY